jgi:menaquinone-dependent protoporphyrinogen oxidase
MVILVGYVSPHGSTRGVAERVAARLGQRGCRVDLRPLDQVQSADAYDAVVLGSAVHNGAWMPEAKEFVRGNARTLASLPVWLFSVGMLGQQGSAFRPAVARRLRALGQGPKGITDLVNSIHPRDHHTFAGLVAPAHLPLRGRVIYRAMGGRYGDFRDWGEIDAWAEGIARQLALDEPARRA